MKFFILSFLFSSGAIAAEIPLRSKVETKIDVEKRLVTFTIIPDKGLVLNAEGPWKVEITDSGKVEFKKKIAARADFDLAAGSTKLEMTKKPAKASSAKYKFVGFVCTADKAKCYRDVHTGELKF